MFSLALMYSHFLPLLSRALACRLGSCSGILFSSLVLNRIEFSFLSYSSKFLVDISSKNLVYISLIISRSVDLVVIRGKLI